MKRKICFITGSRAEYGLLRKLVIASQQDKLINMQIIVTGSHLSKKHGHTYKEIEQDHIQISSKVNLNFKGDSPEDIIHSMSIGLKGFSNSFKKLQPDLLVILGDRYEIFSAAAAAMIMNIPIAHIHGGEVTEGAYDEAIRHLDISIRLNPSFAESFGNRGIAYAEKKHYQEAINNYDKAINLKKKFLMRISIKE